MLSRVTFTCLQTLSLETVVSSVATFPGWTYPNGVVNGRPVMLIELSECSELRPIDFNPQVTSVTPEEILKCIFIRGLAEARMRNPGSDLARYIETFILVQVSP